ncbi:MAG: serine/threonine-protein kinase [Planctomycetota bacterium]
MERTSPRAGDRDSNLEELLAACLERIESDGPQAVESFCREHPRHENELREWVAASYAWGVLAADRRQASHPERLGEYRLLANLGGGGMGVVYLAEQEPLARRVALKLIRPEYLLFPGAKDRFLREVHAIAQLKHPNIVPLYSFGEQSGLPYYAMEHIEGCSLAHVLHLCHGRTAAALRGEDFWGAIEAACGRSTVVPRASSLSGGRTWEETCLRVMQCVAEALEHAHARGVVHRDVKPSNIMITPEGRVLLLDFGLAYERGVSRMTRSGSQLGSLVYMSPEQLRGEASTIDERTDVYAFGVTLYELLALRAPFEGASSEVIAQRIIAGDSAPLRQLNRSLSWEVETVCATAMERDRSRRYASARQLAHDLENILERRPIAARRPGLLRRAWRWAERHPVSSVAMVFASLLLVSSAWFGLERSAAAARAESRRLIAESRAALAADTAQALLLGIAAARQHPSAEANSALMAALSDLNEVRTLVHGDHVVDVDFSNDGRLIVTAGQQRAILWQVPAGKQWRELLHPAAVRSARFSPGGELVVTVCADGSVRAWDLGSGSARVLAAACVAAFIVDDARLVVWNTDGGAAVLAITDGAPLAVLPAAPRSSLKSAAAGQQPDARCVSAASARPLLAARAFGSRCQLWDVERGRAEWLDHPSPLTHLTFSSDGERLLTGCADSTVRLWSRAGGLLEQHRGPGSAVLAGAFSHDGRRFGFSCDDGGAFLHDQRSATRISLSGHEGSVSGVWFAPDDATVLTISGDHAARLWDAGTGAACAVLRGHRRSLLSARFSGDGNYLVTGSEDGTARLWRNPVAVGREETAAFEQLVRLPHWTRACQSARDNQASQRFNEQVWRVLGKHAPLAEAAA